MANFIELTSTEGHYFLFDADSGWEIHDKGFDKPALWSNWKEGRNLNAKDTYRHVKYKLRDSGQYHAD